EHEPAEGRRHDRRDDDVHQRVGVRPDAPQHHGDAEVGDAGRDDPEPRGPQQHRQLDAQRGVRDGGQRLAWPHQQQGRRQHEGRDHHLPRDVDIALGPALVPQVGD
ncbi:hypothetical protein RZS08_65095, partial [Arthrospira platensis SPKY1]|nr:hypothetical protein [Arthrospira platensis SPKY1]